MISLLASPAFAETSKLRPKPRPIVVASVDPAPVAPAVSSFKSVRPIPRPAGLQALARSPAKGVLGALFGRRAKPKSGQPVAGSVCGDRAIRGAEVARVSSAVNGCGIDHPVRVTEVDGVRLSTPATLHCDAAKALKKWVSEGLQPAFGQTPVVELRVAAHYSCRPRNNKKGARISEHGKGRAIDISGFKLSSGKELTVLRDYRAKAGAPIRKAHKAACGTFGTTLGPGSDRHHNDHLHLDVARYRSGPYCK
ncbi:MAG: hypothetical protein ACJASV_002867 [Pseudorhodobacter sp.]|jgi:hypothetical protein